jgi:CelD/BcsL family acetyltransferase involved in cellulose biosynthesis
MTLPGPTAERWDALAHEARSIFATRAWADCWWQHYGRGGTPVILTDDEQSPSYVVPLYVSGRLVKQLRYIGHGPADQLGPVCGPSRTDAAADAVRTAWCDRSLDVDLLHLNDLPEEEAWDARLDAHVIARVASPAVEIAAPGWEEFLSRRSKNFREQTLRRERKLAKSFEVNARLATTESLPRDMATLFRLHQQRWGAGAPFATGVERRFHEAFSVIAMANGWLRLWMLELDGSPVASLYGLRFAGLEYFYQSGRDPAFEAHSVGSVMLTHSIRGAVVDGVTEYRLLRGDESYKSRFADVERHVQSVALGRTVLGRTAVAAVRVRRAL